jgi:hypothetical protein
VADTLHYLYGVVPGDTALASYPPGVDGGAVRTLRVDDLAAIVSVVDRATYHADTVAQLSGDVEWVTPRAAAHDRVLTWAGDRADALVPMPMLTLHSSEAVLRDAVSRHAPELRARLARVSGAREYVVRLFARPDDVAAALSALSESIAELERAAAAATPGQAYLLQRKLAAAQKDEIRGVTARIADEIFVTLARDASDAARDPLPRGETGAFAVLNAAFLVPTASYDAFRSALTALIERYQSAGFRFDFTGPWPPYHFARAH